MQRGPGEVRSNQTSGHTSGILTNLQRIARRITFGLPLRPRTRTAPAAAGSQSPSPLAAFARYNRAYFRRWLFLGVLIGIVAGLGAILFYSAIALASKWLLGDIAGFFPPNPASEGATIIQPAAHPWLIPVVTTLGGLLTGFIVFTLAPEAEGHGTDAAIEAFHRKGGRIRARIPLIKLVASAITIGSGGSAGREGPTAQISAGFGSWLGDLLHLDDHDRRIAVAAGIGSGIGSIFKAPFGGALLSAEILYKRDFEADAIFPSFIASVIGFSIYGAWAGWTPVFGLGGHFSFTQPVSLVGYLILGITAGVIGLLYPTTLYGIRDLFKKVRVPNQFKPAIGGLLVGLIGVYFPQALGMGYGYVQFAINGDFLHMAAGLMAVLIFIKILTTSLTIGSGGSGGVFGPGMVIGGFLGGALWAVLHAVAPVLVAGTPVGAFAVVGMGAFFGGIAKAPLAVILMVAEMTGEYSLIVPAMLATMVAYVITGDVSIYEQQVPTRLDSPAHRQDYVLPLLQNLKVRDAMVRVGEDVNSPTIATPTTPLDEVARIIREQHVASVPIVEDGQLVGIVTAVDLARVPPDQISADGLLARQVMSRTVARVFPDDTLYSAWLRMSRLGYRQLAVVDRQDPTRLLGLVSADTIGQVLRPQTHVERPPTGENGARPAPLMASDVAAEEGEVPMAEEAAAAGEEERVAQLARASDDDDPLLRLHVADAMLRTPGMLPESAPLAAVQARLREYRSVMIVDAQGYLVGIVTQTDLLHRTLSESDGAKPGKPLTAGQVAVRNLVTAQPDETLRTAIRRMTRAGLRQLPVVDGPAPARPVGLLRRSDILEAYEHALAEQRTPLSPSGTPSR